MINRISLASAACFFFSLWVNIAAGQNKINIACVGNSITYGANVADRIHNSYPAQLQAMLGSQYTVSNFGVSGTTVLKNGNKPYWNTETYQEALASRPDIVFIKLGTNDSKAVNRTFYTEFENDYSELIASFANLKSKPRIVLLLPVPSFNPDSNSIYDPVITGRIIPMIQKVAFDKNLEVIDLYSLFTDKADLITDNIHPNSLGATVIARRLYEAVKLNTENGFTIFNKIKEEEKITSFYGFECADFTFNNRICKIVKPKKTAKGHPWILRARFWGHEPQTDIALLERGFHITYCDVAELYGNAEAVSTWNEFYALMHNAGLAKKVTLEGMSRGGIYIYNWALANPRKVVCIYGDAPVLDLKSWPGGKGSSKGSKENWEIFKKDYNLTEEQANSYTNSPLNNAEKIAKLKFPMLHVVGDADDVVPVVENTTPFEERVKAAGGDIKVIHKPGINHHPHSLANPTPIVDFILRASGYKLNLAAVAAPGAEFRSGAGWADGKTWWGQFENIDSLLLAEKNLDIVFLGNSITQGMGGHRTYLSHKPGFSVFDSVFVNRNWECAGISGDRTQQVLYRLQNGNYAFAKPKVMVITIGVNNFNEDDSAGEIAVGIAEILKWTKANMPSTKIILTGPLPTGIHADDERRKKYNQVRKIINKWNHRGYTYLALTHVFVKPDGELDTGSYGGDGIHLQIAGYRAWAAALKPVVDRLLK